MLNLYNKYLRFVQSQLTLGSKTVFILFLFFISSNFSNSQNLVPNGGFEYYTECPYFDHQIHFAYPWYNPGINNFGTSDYVNVCSDTFNYFVGVPQNFWGYQHAHNGNGYAHFGLMQGGIWENAYAAEHIGIPLISDLKKDSCYQLEFWISLPDVSCRVPNQIGAYLSYDSLFNYSNLYPNTLIPQLQLNLDGIDTSSWLKVSGIFTAAGGEKYLWLGGFDSISMLNNVDFCLLLLLL